MTTRSRQCSLTSASDRLCLYGIGPHQRARMGTIETIEFSVDKDIIHSLISRQAGTLAKALLEAIMNAIDAGSTRVAVRLGATGFSVSDDGRGFRSKQEIENWFAV